ncbi:MAG TPA: D-2-hydroxyacid dehydrogenase [Prolixibacteraceae bacterium]|nr:D-2-hydroxyacid dehydrogenase [Prolixibacteraceae bacterium]
MEIVVLDGYTLNPGDLTWDGLAQLGHLTVYDRTVPEETVARAAGAEVVFTNKVLLTREVLSQLPGLRYIGVLATGYNVVDIGAAADAGIVVTNIPAYSTASVAQMVFAHILNFTNRVELHATEVRNGKWTGHPDFSYQSTPQCEIAGKTLGIIGFGQIGRHVGRLGHAFGMRVLFHNRSHVKDAPSWATQVNLEQLTRESDFVSINCPLSHENREFVNHGFLSGMKPSAFLINTGRGPLVHEADLADALNKGIIAGAGLDVLTTEPALPGNPLLTARNCFITPHMAWATLEARTRLITIAVDNLRAFLAGQPQNVIRP